MSNFKKLNKKSSCDTNDNGRKDLNVICKDLLFTFYNFMGIILIPFR